MDDLLNQRLEELFVKVDGIDTEEDYYREMLSFAKKLQVKNYLEAMEMQAIPLRFEQEKVLKSIIPIFPKQDIEDRIGTPIPSITISAMYPFVFDSVKDPGDATLLGVDFSGGVILFNQLLYKIKA